jgi:hypothetical protein
MDCGLQAYSGDDIEKGPIMALDQLQSFFAGETAFNKPLCEII